jgi:hypothetical protein
MVKVRFKVDVYRGTTPNKIRPALMWMDDDSPGADDLVFHKGEIYPAREDTHGYDVWPADEHYRWNVDPKWVEEVRE